MAVAEPQVTAMQMLQWRDRLDRISNKSLSSNHKIVVYRLQVIFVTEAKNEIGYFTVVIGKQPSRTNLVGCTGLSDWTIRACIADLVLNHYLKRLLIPGTFEEEYKDTKLLLKPTSLWIPDNIRIVEKSPRHTRIPHCPHCMSTLLPGTYLMICKECGSQFEEPFYTTEWTGGTN